MNYNSELMFCILKNHSMLSFRVMTFFTRFICYFIFVQEYPSPFLFFCTVQSLGLRSLSKFPLTMNSVTYYNAFGIKKNLKLGFKGIFVILHCFFAIFI
jgi:hypothetical protein